jgi:hypothetical protein
MTHTQRLNALLLGSVKIFSIIPLSDGSDELVVFIK